VASDVVWWPAGPASGRESVTVLTVSYGTRELTAFLLWSLRTIVSWPELEIVVVDNGSRDGSAQLLAEAERGGVCTLLANRGNRQHGPALNHRPACSPRPRGSASRWRPSRSPPRGTSSTGGAAASPPSTPPGTAPTPSTSGPRSTTHRTSRAFPARTSTTTPCSGGSASRPARWRGETLAAACRSAAGHE